MKALQGESATVLGFNQNIFDTAGHFIIWISLTIVLWRVVTYELKLLLP
jgi:hypothetical protein